MSVFRKRAVPADAPSSDAPLEDAPLPSAEMATEDQVSDEGIAVAWLDHETVMNLSVDPYDKRRPALHLAGKQYSHVADAADGAWIYRHDS